MGFEVFLGLLGLVIVLGIPVAVVVLLIRVADLRRRLGELEQRVRMQAVTLPPETSAEPSETAVPVKDAEPVPVAATAPPEEPAPAPIPETTGQDGPIVMRAERVSALGSWLRDNWVYAVSALSLALAGVFFVQYGMEKGLLPPAARVTFAVLFGLALIGAGEWIRRRYGDEASAATAYLPSTFSGAGLVSIFAGIIAARQLYGLIGSETAFAGLLATAVLAVLLGWFHGPFLAAVGLIGAAAAPFLVGGESEAPYWLYGYYAVIAGAGLAVDAVRRWAWVSVLALVLGYGGGWLVLAGTGGAGWATFLLVALALMAVAVPVLQLVPTHEGRMIAETLWSRGSGEWPVFPTRLAGGAVAVSSAILVLLPAQNGAESTLAYLCLAVLTLALVLWADKARALADLAALPAAGFLLRLGLEGLDRWPLAREFAGQAAHLRAPETQAPLTASLLLGMAVMMTLAAAWRSFSDREYRAGWAVGAALVAPLAALALELFWEPALVIGAYPWALQVIALAGLMAALAARYARLDGQSRRRAAYAVLSALSLIAFAMFLVTTKAALTLSLATLVVVAAALDRRFKLPEMGLFIQAAVMVIGWRLIIDPGLIWALEDAGLWEVWASYGSAVLAMAAGLWLLKDLDRRGAQVFMDSALAGYAAVLANVLITRWIDDGNFGDQLFTHWALTLNAMPWLILMLVQLYRLQLGGTLRYLRWALAIVAGVLGLGGLFLSALPGNPLFGLLLQPQRLVLGPLVIDTLLLAYAVPGIALIWSMQRMGHLPRWLRAGLTAIGTALVALYGALEIRRFWRGDDLSVPGVTQAELYSYTVAMMLVGAALLYQAIARRSSGLRRAAMAMIALTVAKVFLIDASGLSGLTRVFSFLALGLSLAGLAWLNRWAAGQQGVSEEAKSD